MRTAGVKMPAEAPGLVASLVIWSMLRAPMPSIGHPVGEP